MPARKQPPPAPETASSRAGKKRVVFSWTEAAEAGVSGTFSGWEILPLKAGAKGAMERVMYLPPGVYEYRFIVNGEWCCDPACAEYAPNPFGTANSVLRVS